MFYTLNSPKNSIHFVVYCFNHLLVCDFACLCDTIFLKHLHWMVLSLIDPRLCKFISAYATTKCSKKHRNNHKQLSPHEEFLNQLWNRLKDFLIPLYEPQKQNQNKSHMTGRLLISRHFLMSESCFWGRGVKQSEELLAARNSCCSQRIHNKMQQTFKKRRGWQFCQRSREEFFDGYITY